MSQKENDSKITVEAMVNAPIEKVWKFWTEPSHIINWNNASPDWHTPNAKNDLRNGGTFSYTMAAKDGSMSFDFGGEYTKVESQKHIDYILGDGREVTITFAKEGNGVKITQRFDPESENSREVQQGGWQAILDNFKYYSENKSV